MNRLPLKGSLVDIFRLRAKETPDLVVSKFQGREFTYREYDQNANKVAIRYIGKKYLICVASKSQK